MIGFTHISLVYWLSGLAFAGPIYGQKTPDINQILPLLMEKGEQDSLYIAGHYTHEEAGVTEHYENGIIAKVEETRYLVEQKDGVLQKKILSKDQLPVSDAEFEPKKEFVTINKKFFERYNFSLIGDEVLDKEACWVLAFSPKNKWPEERMEDRILNNLTGEAWFRRGDLSFRRLRARLIKEVDFAWPGFLIGGRARKITADVEAHTIEGRFAVSAISIEYWYSKRIIFNFNKHGLAVIRYENYKRKEE